MANVTVNFNFPKPDRAATDPAQHIDEAFDGIAAAHDQMDALLKAHADLIAGKSDSDHGHSIGQITGLSEALAAKMPANATFTLAGLTDVSGAGAAPDGYVLIKNSGMWIPASAAAALGVHGHAIGDVTGLGAALSALDSGVAARMVKSANLGDLASVPAARANLGLVLGQCQLVKDGSNLRLNPFDGNLLTTGAGAVLTVPAGGVALAPTGLASSTTYYIYADDDDDDGVVDRLLAGTTAPALSANGVLAVTGDNTRPLVGMARTTSGTAWADDTKNRWVLSYFNRVEKTLENSLTANRTTTSTSFVEINSEIRVNFLSWGEDAVTCQAWGCTAISSSNEAVYTALEIDAVSSSTRFGLTGSGQGSGLPGPASLSGNILPARGAHFVTLSGRASGGTATWFGGDPLIRVFLVGKIKG